jgi:hypothetical protein
VGRSAVGVATSVMPVPFSWQTGDESLFDADLKV